MTTEFSILHDVPLHSIPRILLLATLLAVCGSPATAGTKWHVDAAAAPLGDGLSWATAFDSIDSATALALSGDRIWVKAGHYTVAVPTEPGDPRTATFGVAAGVRLLGGFDGTETAFADRAELFDQTILSGDLGVLGDPSDNAYHVVSAVNGPGIPDGATTVDGFLIRDGNANAAGHSQGGGVLMFNAALRLRNCTMRDNRATFGAGLHAQPASANLRWCEFIDNHAEKNGGAIWGQAINYKVSHCRFSGNTALKGGAIYLHSIGSDIPGLPPIVLISQSLLYDNLAEEGGAIFLGGGEWASGKATISGCTIAYNHATVRGGGILSRTVTQIKAESRVRNSVIWFNRAPEAPNLSGRQHLAYCNVQGGAYGAGVITANPLFVDGPGRNLRLLPGSPSNDSGRNELIVGDYSDADADGNQTEPVPIELAWKRRVSDDPLAPNPGGDTNPIVDMGAYEL